MTFTRSLLSSYLDKGLFNTWANEDYKLREVNPEADFAGRSNWQNSA